MSFNLATMLTESARTHPDRPVARTAHGDLGYAELEALSGRLAAGLRREGLTPGARVAVQLPNLPQFLVAYFGILKAGLVMVPMNPLLTADEIAHQLADSDASLMIVWEGCLGQAVKAAGDVPLFVVGGAGSAPEGVHPFDELYEDGGDTGTAPTGPEDTAVLIYTSGTTGRPKGAELGHFQLYMNCTVSSELFGVEDDDVVMAVLPFFHVFGLSGVVNTAVRRGTTMSVVPRFTVPDVLDAIHRHRVSVFLGVPAMFHALTEADAGDRDLSSLRVAGSGGAAMPEALLTRFEDRFGIVVLEGYGMTETASTATMNRPDERRPLSIGKPVWGVETRVVNAAGEELPPGEVGELLVRGHCVTRGYHGNPAATAEAIRDGWLHTGDLARADDDGFLYIVDRMKDLVIRGGYNVYPREVEEVLHAHPAVAEAAVVGRPDERLGEEVTAYVALRPGAAATPEELIAHSREHLAAYKYPREVVILPELPRNATGKLLKRELRDR
ncbi:long-chain-fatty-acid--CoA ligase [Actinomadura kijaniata]|uniref:long-chain-fatty-acid--CoA ligase n=1 Tax=Actinomadura kijaniata TaxID=46161 RepID=UPI003F1B11C3